MNSNKLSLIFEKAPSFNNIDKSQLNLEDKPKQEQLQIINIFKNNNAFYYDNCINNYTIFSNENKLHIQPESLMNSMSFGSGHEDKIKNLIQPENPLLIGNAIYDLKVKGESIENVEIVFLSDNEYSLPFQKINNEWVLNTFTKIKPLLLPCISWVKFYLKVKTKNTNDQKENISYSYSILLFNDTLNREIMCDSWTFDNIRYQHGFIKM